MFPEVYSNRRYHYFAYFKNVDFIVLEVQENILECTNLDVETLEICKTIQSSVCVTQFVESPINFPQR